MVIFISEYMLEINFNIPTKTGFQVFLTMFPA